MRVSAILMAGLLGTASAMAETMDGVLGWAGAVEMGVPVSGVITEVAVRPGQQVRAGDRLLSLDSTEFEAQLASARATENEARHDKAEAERELARAMELYDRTVLSDHDRQIAEIGAARAGAAWHRARATLTGAEQALRYSRLEAPFNGIVLDVLARPGEVVVSQLRVAPLLRLAPSERMTVRALATPQQLGALRLGQSVEVGVGGRWLPATISALGLEPLPDTPAPRHTVEATFERGDQLPLLVGGAAAIRYP
ncbi:MAG: hypothetical protein C3L25_04445 [Candidatus Sedimenticola endophacoides]|uniref:CzcB-like barrel-sandwich hybrid domain-containing protein n=2 Tax=Candidatus Sedimenticola endophacoides TaxID=2548426 RepID=A0A6N4DQF1_9GAMM|nr:MAG: hypothetical protein B0D94_08740 [Candidatus Sedimenticola endophacoides]PUE00961.1 MAG: hypothetical protein C3L26_04455 [Candidatus Sedimenticola endophacoides]PUE01264.1 MAG: hypothetical protein C3L24_08295 [Candidatus Sedimenticola endophacoides]PUE04352.1 MAG: hypothetical protein C3L25_04445 [Candidatus Sedimenticola endophacoides]